MPKSTVEEIRARFDADVERFSNRQTGQTAAMDSALCMEMIARTAASVTPSAAAVADLGCGAGNYTLALLDHLPHLQATLIDLSRPMLDRAAQRVSAATSGAVRTIQADIRDLAVDEGSVDIILAAAVLHHLRDDGEWDAVFEKLHRWLRPGGGLWIYDMVTHDSAAVQALQWARYGEYLAGYQGDAYREKVFAYIEKEDTPRPLPWQLDRLKAAGFRSVEILHKNGPFAAFGGIR
ncbi:MAG: methyltransferase domain-containing protein [Bryobacteraceae bacterium]|nr:methyltransferase domain-containing protein [Bryobacteraceae bacterium]